MKTKMNVSQRLVAAVFCAVILGALGLDARAAGREGHGGVAVVCRDSAGKITSAELLDFFEAPKHKVVITPKNGASVQDYLTRSVERLEQFTDAFFADRIAANYEHMQGRFKFLPSGVGLELLEDSLPVIRKKGCQFEQVANFDKDGIIWIDAEIHQAMDDLNRAGLIAHETIYWQFRFWAEAKDSVGARQVNAFLFADEIGASRLRPALISIRFSCGLHGSVEEKIRDCADSYGLYATQMITWINEKRTVLKRPAWTMVSSSLLGHRLWQEPETGRLWTDVTHISVSWDWAPLECGAQIADLFGKQVANMGFSLPSKEDVIASEGHGLSRMFGGNVAKSSTPFWTRSQAGSGKAWVYQADAIPEGGENTSYEGEISFSKSAVESRNRFLCVAEGK